MITITAFYEGYKRTKKVSEWAKITGLSNKTIWQRRLCKLDDDSITWEQVVGLDEPKDRPSCVNKVYGNVYEPRPNKEMLKMSRIRLSCCEHQNLVMSGWSI